MKAQEAQGRLSQIAILAAATPEQLGRLAAACTWRTVSPGEEVISHLARETDVYFISEGAFRVRLEPIPDRAVEIRVLEAGQHFGEIAALAESPRSVTVTADSRGLIAHCPADKFAELVRENGAVGLAIASSLARTVISLTDRLFQTSALEVRFRIHAEVLRLAKTGVPQADGLLIKPAPTHHMIAKKVGTHREAVTKEFQHLTKERILRQNRRELLVLNLEKLRELIQKHAGLTASQVVDW